MKGKASDICPKCKYCLGMTPQGMYSCGKANDGSELNIGIDVVLNCANFEWKDGKVEGKVSDICSKCKNCKGTTNEYDGNDFVVITGVECEDPYDGMVKTLDADSSICCSMFEIRTEKSCDKISLLQHELETDKLRMKIHELEKEKSDHLKGIERLKKRAVDSDYYKEKSELLEEKLKEANKLADSWKRDYEFVRDQLIHPIYDILYPDNPNRDINVTDFINNVKDLKVYADENGGCIKRFRSGGKNA